MFEDDMREIATGVPNAEWIVNGNSVRPPCRGQTINRGTCPGWQVLADCRRAAIPCYNWQIFYFISCGRSTHDANLHDQFGGKVSDFAHYMLEQSRRETAYERYNYAGASLENAQIKERLAQIKSQSDPLDDLLKQRMSERERLYAAAYFVVVGRMPTMINVEGKWVTSPTWKQRLRNGGNIAAANLGKELAFRQSAASPYLAIGRWVLGQSVTKAGWRLSDGVAYATRNTRARASGKLAAKEMTACWIFMVQTRHAMSA
jgi:hypothetical protein